MAPSGAYNQDIIAPQWVTHGLEYGDREEDSDDFGHIYNFIDYGFVEGAREIRARHYLDEQGTAIIMHLPAEDDFMMRVLVFLAMRYPSIRWLAEDQRYVLVPSEQMHIVRERMQAHMAAHSV